MYSLFSIVEKIRIVYNNPKKIEESQHIHNTTQVKTSDKNIYVVIAK